MKVNKIHTKSFSDFCKENSIKLTEKEERFCLNILSCEKRDYLIMYLFGFLPKSRGLFNAVAEKVEGDKKEFKITVRGYDKDREEFNKICHYYENKAGMPATQLVKEAVTQYFVSNK
jgi:hypothetical protein